MHLGLGPTGLLLTVFARGSDIDSRALAADGYPRGLVTFPRPMRCDGGTSYRVEITLDRTAATARVSVSGVGEDGETLDLEFEDPLIAAVPAHLAFWQYYTVRGATNLPRFVEVWAAPA